VSTPATGDARTILAGNAVLPEIVSVRPTYRAASFVETSRQVGELGDLPFEQNIVVTGEVDYVTPVASLHFEVHGDLSTFNERLLMTNEHTYTEGDTPDAPWVRTPRTASAGAMDAPGFLKTYGEVVTLEVREAATDVVTTNEILRGIPVTTFQFVVPWSKLPEFAIPTSGGLGDTFMKDELRLVHVTLSVDGDGLLRVYDQQYDEQAWIDAAAAAPEDFDWFSHFRTEVISTSNEPSALAPPASFIDAPAG
jgi:hypothetical protein